MEADIKKGLFVMLLLLSVVLIYYIHIRWSRKKILDEIEENQIEYINAYERYPDYITDSLKIVKVIKNKREISELKNELLRSESFSTNHPIVKSTGAYSFKLSNDKDYFLKIMNTSNNGVVIKIQESSLKTIATLRNDNMKKWSIR